MTKADKQIIQGMIDALTRLRDGKPSQMQIDMLYDLNGELLEVAELED